MSEEAGQRPPEFENGQVIAERFEVIKKIGSSEGGDVYLVRETERDLQMMLKHLRIQSMDDETYEALREEVKEASMVRHRTLGQVFGLGREGDAIFLAMEYIEGQSLTNYLAKRRDQDRSMTVKGALNIILNLSTGLDIAHKAGMVHGALTPRNVYITNQGRVKITNLVYAKLVSRHLAGDQRGAFFDSPFVAPEVRGAPDAQMEPSVDVYSMGMLCAEVLSSNSFDEWDGEPLDFVAKVIEPHHETVQSIMLMAVLPDPSERHQDIPSFKEAIKAFLETPEGQQTANQMVPSVLEEEALSGVWDRSELLKAAGIAAGGESSAGDEAKPTPPPSSARKPPPPVSGSRKPPPPSSGRKKSPTSGDTPRGLSSSGIHSLDTSGVLDLVDLPPAKANPFASGPPAPKQGLDFESGVLDIVSGISGIVDVVDDADLNPHEEIWLVQKDGLDYGPFNVQGVLDMLFRDEITEHNLVLNMRSNEKHPLVVIGAFHEEVVAYIPQREERLAREAAERERRIQQVKSASKFSGAGAATVGLIFAAIAVYAYLQLPDPVATEFVQGFKPFPHAFAMPRVETVSVELGEGKMEGLLDPNASEEKKREARKQFREELLAKLKAEEDAKRKKRGKKSRRGRRRKSRGSGGGGGGGDDSAGGGDEVETLDLANEDLESLSDYEIYELVYSDRIMNKVGRCISQHGGGSVTVSFTIRPSGRLDRIGVSASKGGGGYKNCIKGVFRSVSFREFGGSSKKATVPFEL